MLRGYNSTACVLTVMRSSSLESSKNLTATIWSNVTGFFNFDSERVNMLILKMKVLPSWHLCSWAPSYTISSNFAPPGAFCYSVMHMKCICMVDKEKANASLFCTVVTPVGACKEKCSVTSLVSLKTGSSQISWLMQTNTIHTISAILQIQHHNQNNLVYLALQCTQPSITCMLDTNEASKCSVIMILLKGGQC